MITKIKKVLMHNQFLATAIVIVVLLGVWLMGCDSTVRSPFNPDIRLNRPQLILAWENYAEEVKLAIVDLDRQDLFKQKLFNIGVLIAQGGTVNPVGAGITLLSILGLGAVADNRRKDTVIKTLQNERKSIETV